MARIFRFSNSGEGFKRLGSWIEPTGHYGFNLSQYFREHGIKLVMVNPYAVKQTKELDDNDPSKNNGKDPKVIAKLVPDGRYSVPYIPTGAFADLRILSSDRLRIVKEIRQIKNRFARWFAIYFPEYTEVKEKEQRVFLRCFFSKNPRNGSH